MRGIDLLKDIGTIDDSLVEEASQPIQVKSSNRIDWSVWTRWGGVAAGFLVLCIAAVALQQSFRGDNTTETASFTYSAKDCSAPEIAMEEDCKEEAVGAASDRSIKTDESVNNAPIKDAASSASTTTVTEGKKELQTVKNYSDKQEVLECYAIPEKGKYFYLSELEQALKTYQGQEVQYYVVIDVFGDCKNTAGEIVYEALTYNDAELDKQTSQLVEEYERLLVAGYNVIIEEEELRGYFTEEELETFEVNPEYGYAFRFTEE